MNAGDGVIDRDRRRDAARPDAGQEPVHVRLDRDRHDSTLAAANLDNAAFADSDDLNDDAAPAKRGGERRGRRRADPRRARAAFAAGGYTLTAGWKLDVIRAGSVWKVTDGTPVLGGCYPGICRSS